MNKYIVQTQQDLINAGQVVGSSKTPDGDFGPVTYRAIANLALQSTLADLNTLSRLSSIIDPVKRAQQLLNDIGFDSVGTVDGVWGENSAEGVASLIGKINPGREAAQMALSPPVPQASATGSGFELPPSSIGLLSSVHSDLARLVKYAASIAPSNVRFIVGEGRRTLARQRQLVAKGASQTLSSRHIGGFAVDLFAMVNGKVEWDWKYYYPIIDLMAEACRHYNQNARWGGCWDANLKDITSARKSSEQYVARRKAAGRASFLDGVHVELPSAEYPDT